jgi:hypothetical protein
VPNFSRHRFQRSEVRHISKVCSFTHRYFSGWCVICLHTGFSPAVQHLQSWCQAPSGAQDLISVTVGQLRFCRCGAPSLTTERVCQLQRSQSIVHVICIYNFKCRHSPQSAVKGLASCGQLLFTVLHITVVHVRIVYTRPLSV